MKNVLVDVFGNDELQGLEVLSAPARRDLHHETLDALEDQLRPPQAPADRGHLVRQGHGQQEGDGQGGHAAQRRRL